MQNANPITLWYTVKGFLYITMVCARNETTVGNWAGIKEKRNAAFKTV